MGIFNTLAGILGIEEEGWEDRLKPSIKMTSPDGDQFEAAWTGDSRSFQKKLGLWNYPGIKGTRIQDLDVNGDAYTIGVHFVGKDNDLEARRFFLSAKQNGKWSINHPNLDTLVLYISSVNQENDPIGKGNISSFKVEFLEPIDEAIFISTSQLSNDIKATGLLADISAASQFASNVVQDSFSKIAAVSNGVKKGVRAIENLQIIPASATALITGINATIENTPIDLSNLSSQIQEFTALIGGSESTESATANYVEFLNAIPAPTSSEPTDESKNESAVQELWLTAGLNGIAQAQSIGGTVSRSQAIDNANLQKSMFDQVTDTLDINQTTFENSPIEKQYFSQSESYIDTLLLVALGVRFSLTTGFDLAVERRFITARERSPVEITVTEYGTLGENDSNLDLFLESNGLMGKSIRLVPIGTELVIY